MGNISAELLPLSGAVRLTITAPSGVARITRADANGINDVRALPGTYGVPAPDGVVITDYEPASGPLRYDVEPVGGVLESLDVAGFVLNGPWLFTPIIPGYSRPLALVTDLPASYTSNTTIHDGLLGRDDPIAVMRPLGMRRGTMKIFAGTVAQAMELLDPLRQATVMMLRQPDHAGLDMYFAAESAELIHYDQEGPATLWGVGITYVEVKRPEGDLAGALGWTYLDLLAATPRYADQRRKFATYADMRLNKRITP